MQPDWTQAKLILEEPKQPVGLCLEKEITGYFKAQCKGHIPSMEASLKACVKAHLPHTRQMKGRIPSFLPM